MKITKEYLIKNKELLFNKETVYVINYINMTIDCVKIQAETFIKNLPDEIFKDKKSPTLLESNLSTKEGLFDIYVDAFTEYEEAKMFLLQQIFILETRDAFHKLLHILEDKNRKIYFLSNMLGTHNEYVHNLYDDNSIEVVNKKLSMVYIKKLVASLYN